MFPQFWMKPVKITKSHCQIGGLVVMQEPYHLLWPNFEYRKPMLYIFSAFFQSLLKLLRYPSYPSHVGPARASPNFGPFCLLNHRPNSAHQTALAVRARIRKQKTTITGFGTPEFLNISWTTRKKKENLGALMRTRGSGSRLCKPDVQFLSLTRVSDDLMEFRCFITGILLLNKLYRPHIKTDSEATCPQQLFVEGCYYSI